MSGKTILTAWSKILLSDLEALRAIAEGNPDSKLPPDLNAKVPHLVRRKWLMACGCSDGDYVQLTAEGREWLQKSKTRPLTDA